MAFNCLTITACTDDNCVSCTRQNSICELCTLGLVVLDGHCIAACPAGYSAVNGVCAAVAVASSSTYSTPGLIAGLVVAVVVVVVAVIVLRVALQRRHLAMERNLKEALLDSEEEGQLPTIKLRYMGCVGLRFRLAPFSCYDMYRSLIVSQDTQEHVQD